MSSIKIYKKEHLLPDVNGSLTALQKKIDLAQKHIQIGKKTGFLGFGKKLSFKEKFEQMKFLVEHYEEMLDVLTEHEHSYSIFFEDLSVEIYEMVSDKIENIQKVEQRRQILEVKLVKAENMAGLEIVKSQKDSLLRSVHQLAYATVLIIKKLELFQNAMQKLAEDQDLQRDILFEIMDKMSTQSELYALQMDVESIAKDIEQFTQNALNFEDDMRESIGPFQNLFEEVLKADVNLADAVSEIKEITDTLLNSNSISASESIDDDWVNFLVQSNLIKDRLEDLSIGNGISHIDHAELVDVPHTDEANIDNSLKNIKDVTQAVVQPILNKREREKKEKEKKEKKQRELLNKLLNKNTVYVEGGTFMMGSEHSDAYSDCKAREST